jgi:hypothetical protein
MPGGQGIMYELLVCIFYNPHEFTCSENAYGTFQLPGSDPDWRSDSATGFPYFEIHVAMYLPVNQMHQDLGSKSPISYCNANRIQNMSLFFFACIRSAALPVFPEMRRDHSYPNTNTHTPTAVETTLIQITGIGRQK